MNSRLSSDNVSPNGTWNSLFTVFDHSRAPCPLLAVLPSIACGWTIRCELLLINRKTRPAPGRYLAHPESAGKRAAAITRLTQSAKLNGLTPNASLMEMLTRLPTHPNKQINGCYGTTGWHRRPRPKSVVIDSSRPWLWSVF